MNKFIRFYNQNRYMIWLIVLIIVAIISLIQILDNFAYKKNDMKPKDDEETITTINKNYSVLTGKNVKKETSKIIDDFISYCNNKEIEKAYELLSKECKEILYPSLEDFTKNYYNLIFDSKKSYACQAWITNKNLYTYRIDFTKDMLATGKPSKTSILDYYTVVKNNDEYKLNINKFVGTKEINKAASESNINIMIKRKIIYMDYEKYEFEVKNNTKYDVMLNNLNGKSNIYVEDAYGQKYLWCSNEIIEDDVTIIRGNKKTTLIKFDKEYNPKREAVKMIFENVLIRKSDYIDIYIGI